MSKITVNRGSTDNSRTGTPRRSSGGWMRIGQSERIVSMLAGTQMLGSALRNHSFMSAGIKLGLSAGLLHRGATGRCGFAMGFDKMNEMLDKGCNQVSQRMDMINDQVSEAGDESFPASDAPSFTPVTGEADRASHMNK